MFAVNKLQSRSDIPQSTLRSRRASPGDFALNLHNAGAGRGGATSGGRAPLQDSPASSQGGSSATSAASQAQHPGLSKLREALQSLGPGLPAVNISYSEETVGYPGGSYVNRLLKVTCGGKTESFCADLTAKNPLITANEIKRYFT